MHASNRQRRRMAIISSYFEGETYGLLGPQMAATLIRDHSPFECIVIAVTREDRPAEIKKALQDYFGSQRPLIGFSTLSGREDLFALAGELKASGAVTILAGPQADVDFKGEHNWPRHANRFKGWSANFSMALQGPAEQIFPVLEQLEADTLSDTPGVLYKQGRAIRQNPPIAWDPKNLTAIDWHTLYRLKTGQLVRHEIKTAQVLQQIGCPYASQSKRIAIDFPGAMHKHSKQVLHVDARGCSFCDVAVDKGYYGTLNAEAVMNQIAGLPEDKDGRKIAFELINEYPLPGLERLLDNANNHGIGLTQINLTLRADGLINSADHLRNALKLAYRSGTRIVLASVGFESFDDRILRNLHKGSDVAMNLTAVRLMRTLKKDFPKTFGYLRSEGGNHGFIHPTPWDTPASESRIKSVIAQYGLNHDILPNHSTPLIIHHASVLGDWIRRLEKEEALQLKRYDAIIGWWEIGESRSYETGS